jgi:hypothetical protein
MSPLNLRTAMAPPFYTGQNYLSYDLLHFQDTRTIERISSLAKRGWYPRPMRSLKACQGGSPVSASQSGSALLQIMSCRMLTAARKQIGKTLACSLPGISALANDARPNSFRRSFSVFMDDGVAP